MDASVIRLSVSVQPAFEFEFPASGAQAKAVFRAIRDAPQFLRSGPLV
jgi:hypothetical protein